MTFLPETMKQNMIRIMKHMSDACPRIACEKTPQAIRTEGNIPHPLFNRVIAYSGASSEAAAADIRSIANRYRAFNLPFSWLTWSHDDDAADLAAILDELGLHKVSGMSGMALELDDWTYAAPAIPEFEVKRIRTREDFRWFSEIALAAFGLQGEAGELFAQANEAAGIGERAVFRHYVGLLDGRPAGVATAFHDGDIIGIYNVATAEDFRRRGIGSAVTAHAIREGRSAGGRYAVLQASQMGQGVYDALGFREAVRIGVYLG